jgi:hypothetical protein
VAGVIVSGVVDEGIVAGVDVEPACVVVVGYVTADVVGAGIEVEAVAS